MKYVKKKITYRHAGDYLVPNLALPKECEQIGKYGHLRLNFLKENKKGFYIELMLNGSLTKHLADIDKTANAQVKSIIQQLAKSQNIDEKLKQTNQLEWVNLMNNFKNSAEEIVLKELIYV